MSGQLPVSFGEHARLLSQRQKALFLTNAVIIPATMLTGFTSGVLAFMPETIKPWAKQKMGEYMGRPLAEQTWHFVISETGFWTLTGISVVVAGAGAAYVATLNEKFMEYLGKGGKKRNFGVDSDGETFRLDRDAELSARSRWPQMKSAIHAPGF